MNRVLCQVCHRPGPDRICSRRCQGLRKLKSSLDPLAVRRRILEELGCLQKGASICPGRLSLKVLSSLGFDFDQERDALSLLREVLFAMREEGSLRFFQKNILVPRSKGPFDIRGPFRIRSA